MLIRPLLFLAALTFNSTARAQVSCGPHPEVPADIQQRIQGDIEGKAQVFSKLLGDVNLKGKVESSRNEVYQKFRDLDKSQIDRYMIWVSCQNIMLDKQLSPADKSKLWIEIYRELTTKPPEKGGASNFPTLTILRSLPLGQSSISYAQSLLGIPRDEGVGRKVFERDGFTTEISYATSDADKGLRKGIVKGIHISPSKLAVGPPSEVAFDGPWNPEACAPRICLPAILPSAQLNKTTFSDFTATDCDDFSFPWDPAVFPESMTVCIIIVRAETTINLHLAKPSGYYWETETVKELKSLYHYARAKYPPPPDFKSVLEPAKAEEYALRYGLQSALRGEGFAPLLKRLQKELADRKVYAFAIELNPGKYVNYKYEYYKKCTSAACEPTNARVP